jgi:hypothetical protein
VEGCEILATFLGNATWSEARPMSFTPFDPLEFKNTKVNDAALGALKREIDTRREGVETRRAAPKLRTFWRMVKG